MYITEETECAATTKSDKRERSKEREKETSGLAQKQIEQEEKSFSLCLTFSSFHRYTKKTENKIPLKTK